MRIGIMGGTFDPLHMGHLVAAANAKFSCRLDKVLLVVAPNPWQKIETRELTAADVRFRCVEAALKGLDGLEASSIEIDRGGITYTIDTLSELKARMPDAELFLIGGSDMAAGLHSWRQEEELARLAELIIVHRPGDSSPLPAPFWKVRRVDIPALDISSTDLRKRIADGRPLDFLVPQPVLDVLRSSGLYSGVQKFEQDSDLPVVVGSSSSQKGPSSE